MDSAAAVLGQPSCYYTAAPSSLKELRASSKSVTLGRRLPAIGILSSRFCDQGHVQYYNPKNYGSIPMAMGGKEDRAVKEKAPKNMKKKKQLKLLKELSRDLSTFSQMGFGLDSADGLVDQVKRNMMTEATNLLLERLEKMRAEEKEMKRKMKEEKERVKASQMGAGSMNGEMSSSSSSSESSDDECGEVVDMKSLHKSAPVEQSTLPQVMPPPIDSIQSNVAQTTSLPAIPSPSLPLPPPHKTEYTTNIACTKPGNAEEENSVNSCSKKIEVCMGGKCKKSGGAALLEELQKAVGIEGAVAGCKCMGKCKEGPNVKLLNAVDNSVGTQQPSNALCIGVGLEDVEMIVANFMGQNQLGFAAAS